MKFVDKIEILMTKRLAPVTLPEVTVLTAEIHMLLTMNARKDLPMRPDSSV